MSHTLEDALKIFSLRLGDNEDAVLTVDEADQAHEVLQRYQDAIVILGADMLENLNPVQQEYVLDKCNDEFRFWRVGDHLRFRAAIEKARGQG
jgi:hypothetical protein